MTICVSMIVKNESHVIKRCLDSLAPYVNSFCIVDTGSTDGTQDIVKAYPNTTFFEQPWVNFGKNRQDALEQVRRQFTSDVYVLFFDADDVLAAPPDFQWPDLTLPGYTIPIHYSDTRYSRCCLVRSDSPWRWEGVVHEYLTSDVPLEQGILTEPHIIVMHDGARSKDPDTYKKDAEILELAERTPRNVFYLAQSYRDSGQSWKALFAYEERAAMTNGWEEEAWYSTYEAAKLMERLDVESSKVISAYLESFQRRPTRAEPLYQLARYLRMQQKWVLAYMFGVQASICTRPGDRLFLDNSIYSWRALEEVGISAYYVGRFEEGKAANWKLLTEGLMPESERTRIQKNLDFYHK